VSLDYNVAVSVAGWATIEHG